MEPDGDPESLLGDPDDEALGESLNVHLWVPIFGISGGGLNTLVMDSAELALESDGRYSFVLLGILPGIWPVEARKEKNQKEESKARKVPVAKKADDTSG